jgi:hypothetical protein
MAKRSTFVGECGRCSRTAKGRPYLFYYGTHLDTSKRVTGSWPTRTEITTKRFQICGTDEVFLCSKCVGRRAAAFTLLALILSLPWFWVYHTSKGSPADRLFVTLFIALLTSGIVIWPLVSAIHSGGDLAIKTRRKTHELRGFHSFFRVDQYRKMK